MLLSEDKNTHEIKAYLKEDDERVYLGNAFLEFAFNKAKGGIFSVIHKSSKNNFRKNKESPCLIFRIWFKTKDREEAKCINNLEAVDCAYDWERTGKGIRLTLRNSGLGEYNIKVKMTVFVPDDSNLTTWKINIENNDNLTINKVEFPLISGFSKIGEESEDDFVATPFCGGVLLKNPYYTLENGEEFLPYMYPNAEMSMQFIALYGKKGGLYISTKDADGNVKCLSLKRVNEEYMEIICSHYLPKEKGNNFQQKYPIVIGFFQGDWYTAAEIYKKWAIHQKWCTEKLSERDTPEWFKRPTPILMFENYSFLNNHVISLDEMSTIIKDLSNTLNLNFDACIFAWEHSGSWTGPRYFPPREGEEKFVQAMRHIKKYGSHGFAYISGTVWRIASERVFFDDSKKFEENGKENVSMTEDRKPTIRIQGTVGPGARMCPYTQFWRETVLNNTLECLRLGLDMVQIDEFPDINPCYNESHDHPLGYGNWIGKSWLKMLLEIRKECKKRNPDFVISIEEPCEFYIRSVDGYLSRDNMPELFGHYTRLIDRYGSNIETIPLFTFVYHEYITAFGHENVFLNPDKEMVSYYRRALAKSFILGKVQSGGQFFKKGGLVQELVEFYMKTSLAESTYAKTYVICGRMLEPPRIIVPTIRINYLDFDKNYVSFDHENPSKTLTEHSILSSAWKSSNNSVGYVFANISDKPVVFNWEISPHDLNLDNYTVYSVRDGAYSIIFEKTLLPKVERTHMKPNEILLIAVVDPQSEEAKHIKTRFSA
jgi:hypothetical protein